MKQVDQFCMFFMTEREKYRYAMMQAIERARTPFLGKAKESKTDGLRTIRRFERVNKVTFDPFNTTHLGIIEGGAVTISLIRRARKITERSS